MSTNNTYYITEEHMGDIATKAQAMQVIEALQAKGFQVRYGNRPSPRAWDWDWDDEEEFNLAFDAACRELDWSAADEHYNRASAAVGSASDGAPTPIPGTTIVVGIDDDGDYWITDNGEETSGLSENEAIELVAEFIQQQQ